MSQEKALDLAFKSSQDAIHHEHELLSGKVDSLKETESLVESRVKQLEINRGQDVGGKDIIKEVVRWLVWILGLLAVWYFTSHSGK